LTKVKPEKFSNNLKFLHLNKKKFYKDILRFKGYYNPGLIHFKSPNFYVMFPARMKYASILLEILSAYLSIMAFTWDLSPAYTELEDVE